MKMNWIYTKIIKPVYETVVRIAHDRSGEFRITSCVPRHKIEAIARTFFPDLAAFYQTEEGQREFEEWRAKRKKKAKKEVKAAE